MRKLFLVIVALAAAAPAPAAAATPCHPKGSTTVVQSSLARVYRLATGPTQNYGAAYACNLRTGKRRRLDDVANDGFLYGRGYNPPPPQLVGRFLLYSVNFQVGAGEFDTVELLELKSFRHRSLRGCLDDVDHYADMYFVNRSGAVACSTTRGDTNEILLARYRERLHVIDAGPAVDTESLRPTADRRHITWTSGGVEKTARF